MDFRRIVFTELKLMQVQYYLNGEVLL